jgi:protein-tyrosine phosphatase
MAEMILKRTGRVPPREILDPILKVRAEYLQAALDSVTMEWGSLAAYLVQVGGLDEAKRERLAAAYLEGPIRC